MTKFETHCGISGFACLPGAALTLLLTDLIKLSIFLPVDTSALKALNSCFYSCCQCSNGCQAHRAATGIVIHGSQQKPVSPSTISSDWGSPLQKALSKAKKGSIKKGRPRIGIFLVGQYSLNAEHSIDLNVSSL